MASLNLSSWAYLLVGVTGALTIGCDDDPRTLDFRIVTAPGEDPFDGADELEVALEELGREEPVLVRRFPIEDTSGSLGTLPFGTGYRFRVDALRREVLLSRGRSFPFDLVAGEPLPRPDVFVSQVGLFVTPVVGARLGAAVEVMDAIEGGALLAATDGTIHRYRAHSDQYDGAPSFEEVGNVSYLSGAAWVGLGEGLLLAIGGIRGGVHLLDADGRVLSGLPRADLGGQLEGQALVVLPSQRAALIVGGAPGPDGADLADVRRVDVLIGADGTAELRVSELPPLPRARRDAAAVVTAVPQEAGAPIDRVLVLGGTERGRAATSVVVVDPAGEAAPDEWELGPDLHGAAAASIFPGRVMVAGGLAPDGAAQSAVRVISVRWSGRGELDLDLVSPPPDPLFEARAHASALRLGEGLVLILGGHDGAGRPLASAELFDAREGSFPGWIDPTGALPGPAVAPRAALLGDGSVLASHPEGLSVYVPPFDP